MTEVGTSGVMSAAVSAVSTVREAGNAQDHRQEEARHHVFSGWLRSRVRIREVVDLINETKQGLPAVTPFQKALQPMALDIVSKTDQQLLTDAHRVVMQAVVLGCQTLMIDESKFQTHPKECGEALRG
jgi:chemotaxis regulatin CheY-phosphate phosphatase CheZ